MVSLRCFEEGGQGIATFWFELGRSRHKSEYRTVGMPGSLYPERAGSIGSALTPDISRAQKSAPSCRRSGPSYVLVSGRTCPSDDPTLGLSAYRQEHGHESHPASLVRKGYGGGDQILHILDPRLGDGIGPPPSRRRRRAAGRAASRSASFTLGDQRYMAIEAGPLDPFNHSFSIMVECDTQAEIDRLWDALKRGRRHGTVRLAAGPLGALLADCTQKARRIDGRIRTAARPSG